MASVGGSGLDGIRVIAGSSIFERVSESYKSLDCYIDAKSVPSIIPALSTMTQLKGRSVKLRCVTEITQDSLSYCKQLMKYFELYHVPSLTGTFMIIDEREYLGYATGEKGEELILISVPSFVQSQQFLFNKLTENALPAKQRILEISKGGEAEFMETIRDPQHVKELLLNLINSAIYEISILFSNRQLLFLAEREGILDALGSLSKNGIRVRILVMYDNAEKENPSAERKFAEHLRVNYLQQFLPSRITTIIVDESKSLVMEVTDSTKETFQEAIGLATYSNSESTVFSNTSMFESLWIQSELDKQNKVKQVYFQMFKGFKLKDEVYSRRWAFENNENRNQADNKQ